MSQLHYLYGRPEVSADLRSHNNDFRVEEILPFTPVGEGEHHLLHICKEGLTTNQVASLLSSLAKVHPKEVTYAGQKDKNAITQQWFGVRIPGLETPAWEQLCPTLSQVEDGAKLSLLAAHRHNKKLRIGTLKGNRFTITLRNVTHMEMLLSRIEMISQQGVPNYFGEQRFGHDGNNLVKAREMFAGRKIKDRKKRSMYLSAIRSHLYNLCVSHRLALHGSRPIAGDCVILAGSKSFFNVSEWDPVLLTRLKEEDIQLSAPMWGRGPLDSTQLAQELETQALINFEKDCQGLEQAGLEQQRRSLLIKPEQLEHKVIDSDVLELTFSLPAGSFATGLLRELVNYTDVKQDKWREQNKVKGEITTG